MPEVPFHIYMPCERTRCLQFSDISVFRVVKPPAMPTFSPYKHSIHPVLSSSVLLCALKHLLLHLTKDLEEESSGRLSPSYLLQCQVSQGSPYDYSLHVQYDANNLLTSSTVRMSNAQSLSTLTSLPPIASNIFSSCTLSCWMLFIRMQGWWDKSRCLSWLRVPIYFQQWYSLCLSTLPQVPQNLRFSQWNNRESRKIFSIQS